MRYTKTYEDEPETSTGAVKNELYADFSPDTTGTPSVLPSLIAMLGKEKEECGGVAAIKEAKKEYFARRGPEDRAFFSVREFEEFLCSPSRNGPIIAIEDPDRPRTSHALAILGAPGETSALPANPKTLKVKIYMGSGWEIDFPKLDGGSSPDLFVKLKIQGLPIARTKVQRNNWMPSWGEEFEFPLSSPEDAKLIVKVYDSDKFFRTDFAGKNTLHVSELRPGIRAVPLFDKRGNQCSTALLLVRFMFAWTGSGL